MLKHGRCRTLQQNCYKPAHTSLQYSPMLQQNSRKGYCIPRSPLLKAGAWARQEMCWGGWRGEHRELKGPYVRNARPPPAKFLQTSPGFLGHPSICSKIHVKATASHSSPSAESRSLGSTGNVQGGWRGEHRELKGPYVRNARPPPAKFLQTSPGSGAVDYSSRSRLVTLPDT